MAVLQEIIRLDKVHPHPSIHVWQCDKSSGIGPKSIIDLHINEMQTYTPDELLAIAEWLNKEAKRIDLEYDYNGNRIKTEE